MVSGGGGVRRHGDVPAPVSTALDPVAVTDRPKSRRYIALESQMIRVRRQLLAKCMSEAVLAQMYDEQVAQDTWSLNNTIKLVFKIFFLLFLFYSPPGGLLVDHNAPSSYGLEGDIQCKHHHLSGCISERKEIDQTKVMLNESRLEINILREQIRVSEERNRGLRGALEEIDNSLVNKTHEVKLKKAEIEKLQLKLKTTISAGKCEVIDVSTPNVKFKELNYTLENILHRKEQLLEEMVKDLESTKIALSIKNKELEELQSTKSSLQQDFEQQERKLLKYEKESQAKMIKEEAERMHTLSVKLKGRGKGKNPSERVDNEKFSEHSFIFENTDSDEIVEGILKVDDADMRGKFESMANPLWIL